MGESIGAVHDSPVRASSERLRAILPGVIDAAAAPRLTERFATWCAVLEDPRGGVSRVSVRAVVEDGAVGALAHVEATVPLEAGTALVYLGANAAARELDATEAERLDEICAAAAKNHDPGGGPALDKVRARLEGARRAGYAIEVARDPAGRRRLRERQGGPVGELLARFGYTPAAAHAVLSSDDCLIATAAIDGTAVGVAVAERAEVPLGARRSPLRLAELTDSSVDDGHVGHGLQLVMHAHLIAALCEEELAYLIFSESGYTASLFNAASLGRHFAGRLPRHAHIGDLDSPADSSYQSLEVTYLPDREARRLVTRLTESGSL